MKKIISLSLLFCLVLSLGTNVQATRMRETEKELNKKKNEEAAAKDWGSINYVDNLPGPDFSGYTYGDEEIEIPNYNNYKDFTKDEITNFSDAIVDLKGWEGLIGSLKYDLEENVLNFTQITAANDSNKMVTGYSRKKFGWEDISFKMKMNDELNTYSSWAGITVLADTTQKVQWSGVQGYLIVMKKNQVELQKYFPSQEMLGVYEHDTIKVNTWQNYDLQLSPEGEALRIKFIVDGVTIFDYLDEDTSNVLKEGYVNFYAGGFNLDLQPTAATIAHNDSGVNGGEKKNAELIALKPGKAKAYVDGEMKAIDSENDSVTPINENGRVKVPIRFISEALGATVSWSEETKTAHISKNGNNLSVVPGFAEYTLNGKTFKTDAPVKNENGRLLVPIRMVTEGLGMRVLWENEIVWVSNYDYELGEESRANAIKNLQ